MINIRHFISTLIIDQLYIYIYFFYIVVIIYTLISFHILLNKNSNTPYLGLILINYENKLPIVLYFSIILSTSFFINCNYLS